MIYESKAALYEKAVQAMDADRLIVQHAFKIENYLDAAEMFEQVGNYKEAVELAQRCRELAEQTKTDEVEYRYQLAVEQKEQAKGPKGYEKAEKMLKQVAGYKDADQLLTECITQRERLQKKRKVKKILKVCVLLFCAGVVVKFLQSPSWETVQQKMLEMNQTMTEVAVDESESEN